MKPILFVFTAFLSLNLNAQKFQISILKDINPDSQLNFLNQSPQGFTIFKDRMFFSYSETPLGPFRTFSTDGTSEGTRLLTNRNYNPRFYVAAGDLLFFSAEDSTHGVELWATDGTDSGTYMVKDIGKNSNPSPLAVLDNILYLTAAGDSTGNELWRSDGTEQGTYLVKDIIKGYGTSFISEIQVYKGKLLFVAWDSIQRNGIFTSDGTQSGTNSFTKGFPADSFVLSSSPVIYNQKIYFSVINMVHGYQMWESDGTSQGTKMFRKFEDGSYGISNFVIFKQKLCFPANDGVNGYEVWCTDGTSQGTIMLTNINPSLFMNGPEQLTVYNERLYFNLNDGLSGKELWSTDIMPNSARLLKDINPGVGASNCSYFTLFAGKLFFSADTDIESCALWYTDGTESGTKKVPFPSGKTKSSSLCTPYSELLVYNDVLYFSAIYDNKGVEIWKCEDLGLSIDPEMAKNDIKLYPNPAGGNLISFSEPIEAVISDVNGRELMSIKGTEADISSLCEGVYFIRTMNGSAFKFVVQR